jgi:hypothetical protein
VYEECAALVRATLLKLVLIHHKCIRPFLSHNIPLRFHCCQEYEECAALVGATLLKLVLIHHNFIRPSLIHNIPLRFHCCQVHEECAALVRATHLKVVPMHGGQPMVQEVLAMRKGMRGGGADILISTPGRLLDHVEVCVCVFMGEWVSGGGGGGGGLAVGAWEWTWTWAWVWGTGRVGGYLPHHHLFVCVCVLCACFVGDTVGWRM